MENSLIAASVAASLLLAACGTSQPVRSGRATEVSGPLFEKVSALDREVFEAFNTCGAPGQLEKHGAYFAEAVEFYHDAGGVTWNRREMLANTEKFVCGNFRRELVAGSMRVYPVKDFGAISQGVHRFCQFKTGLCEGAADFVIIWRQEGASWSITRVLSYGHRPG